MYTSNDIYPVADFNRKPSEHIKRVQESKKAELLTVNGKAAVVLVDPESYDEMAQSQDLLKTLKTIAIANEQHESGQGKTAQQVFERLKQEFVDKYPDAVL